MWYWSTDSVTILTSFELRKKEDDLRKKLGRLPFNFDLLKLSMNISLMIGDISKLEVEARRRNKPEYTKEKVDEVLNAMDRLEKLIIIATLMN